MTTPTPYAEGDLQPMVKAATKLLRGACPWLDPIAWPVRTDRLRLRPATRDNLEAAWQFRRLEEVSRWLTRPPATREESRSGFEDAATSPKASSLSLTAR